MKRTQNNKGFTIIEVVLVLAIAGLIFLMVFIALPALQAGQRDTARKSDVSNVAAALNSYSSANRGTLPAAGNTLDVQLGATGSGTAKTYKSLSNNINDVVVKTSGSVGNVIVKDAQITVYIGFKCGTAVNTATTTSLLKGTARQYASVTLLEGGAGTGYCLSS